MKATVILGLFCSLALTAVAVAQTPTPTPSPVGTPTATATTASPTSTATATATATPVQPTPTPTPALPPGGLPEGAFNFDVVREVVYELRATDGVVHYVTLSQDTAGIVRVRLSLFNFPPGNYTLLFHPSESCGVVGGTRTVDIFTFPGGGLVLHFRNTTQLLLEPISNAKPFGIFDVDGNALGLFRSEAVTNGSAVACAIIPKLVPPATGTGAKDDGGIPLAWVGAGSLAVLALLSGSCLGWRARRK